MIKKENIIYFSSDEWGGHLRTSQYHVAVRFARDNKVLFVNSIGMRNPTASKRDISKIAYKLRKWLSGITKVNDNFYVFSPIVIPFYNNKMALKINKFLLICYIKFYQHKYGFTEPIVVTFLPNVVDILGNFNEKMSIYYCADQMSSFLGVPPSILHMENRLLKKVDIVLATSKVLFEEKKKINNNTYYLPHGVDKDIFSQALNDETKVPEDIASVRKPIIGFFGLICYEWIDFELLEFMAEKRPDWSIVLIGNVAPDVPSMNKWNNVIFLGPKNYESLPTYCKAFNVGIIPFRLTELGRNVNPLKLKEYLAAGNPVVSTALPEVEIYKDTIYIADDKEQFVKYVELAIAENDKESKKKRSESMKYESWDSKFIEIENLITDIFLNKANRKAKADKIP